MRNLIGIKDRSLVLGEDEVFTMKSVSLTSCESVQYVAFERDGVHVLSEIRERGGEGITAEEIAILCPESVQASQIVAMHVLSDSNQLAVAYACGDLFNLTLGSNHVECVGSIESGISAIEWSPDSELVVIVTGDNSLLLMTTSFEIVSEIKLNTIAAEKQVNVGWGSKLTQFHGSEGKNAAQTTINSNSALSMNDDGSCSITWRGDGNYFCVSSIDKDRRRLSVYNRDCVLQSASEDVNGLEANLAWRPLGNLIAASQLLPHRHDVVFFERNGLRHGEFTFSKSINDKVRITIQLLF